MNWGFPPVEAITKMAWERGTWERMASQHPAPQPSPSPISFCPAALHPSSSWPPAFPTLPPLRLPPAPLWKTAFQLWASYSGAYIRNCNFMVTQGKKPICPTGAWAEPGPRRQCGQETWVGSKGNSLSSQCVIKTQGTWLILGIKPSGTKLHGYFRTKMPSLSVSLFLLQCSKMSQRFLRLLSFDRNLFWKNTDV